MLTAKVQNEKGHLKQSKQQHREGTGNLKDFGGKKKKKKKPLYIDLWRTDYPSILFQINFF